MLISMSGRIGIVLAAGLLAGPAQATSTTAVAPKKVVVTVLSADTAAAALASRGEQVLIQRGGGAGFKPAEDPGALPLLDQSPEDLVKAATRIESARASLSEGIELTTGGRVETAQEHLAQARAGFLEAAAAPRYDELAKVHLYLGMAAQKNQELDTAAREFRKAAFLKGPRWKPDRETIPPSIIAAYVEARDAIGAAGRGSIKVESDPPGATLWVDGELRGTTPRALANLPEGEHYLQLLLSGRSPRLLTATVKPGEETAVRAALPPTGPAFRESWESDRADPGGSAIASILNVEFFLLGSARSTVAGVSPFEMKAVLYQAGAPSRIRMETMAASSDPAANEVKLARLADTLYARKEEAALPPAEALFWLRNRFLAPQTTLLQAEVGGAYQNGDFDDLGNYGPAPYPMYSGYFESRTAVHLRYGLSDRVTLVADIPFLTKELTENHWCFQDNPLDCADPANPVITGSQRVTNAGLGDIVEGFDLRLPRFERDPLFLAYVSVRTKLPTADDTSNTSLASQTATTGTNAAVAINVPSRSYDSLPLGTGEVDLYLGLGGMLGRGTARLAFEVGYDARLPAELPWARDPNGTGARKFVKLGDEEKLHVDGAIRAGRWLAPEVGLDLLHRHATHGVPDPILPGSDARDCYLLTGSGALRAELSEKHQAGLVIQYPLLGRITETLFPMEATGPRAWIYYGIRL